MTFTIRLKPMDHWYLNWIEIANDILYISTNYFLFLFSDFIILPSFRYSIGGVFFKYLISSLIAIFLFIVFMAIMTVRDLYKAHVHKQN